MEPDLNAACYIRVSTEEQTEYSPDAQRRAMEVYATQHRYRIHPAHIYVDAGISGRSAEKRPAFLAMIRAARVSPRPFQVILVHKFDRFARSREDSIVYKSMLRRQCGVRVVSITEPLEDGPMRPILEAMLEAMAEYYSLNLGEEVSKGMTEKALRGGLQAAAPFGYRAEANRLVPIPQEAAVVTEIFQAYLAGHSLSAIARQCQEAGVLTHRGNLFQSRTVRYLLGNPAYAGFLRWTPRQGPPILAPAGHSPLVSQETFAQVAALLHGTTRSPHARPPETKRHWLSGLVRCARCGKGLVFVPPRYLRCGGYAKGQCQFSQHIPAARLESALLARLLADARHRSPVTWTLLPPKENAWTPDRAQAALERKRARLQEAYLCGVGTAEDYQKKLAALQTQMEALSSAPPSSSAPATAAALQNSLDTFLPPDPSPPALGRAVNRVLSLCRFDRDTHLLELVYRFPPTECLSSCTSGDQMGNWVPPCAICPSDIPCPTPSYRPC